MPKFVLLLLAVLAFSVVLAVSSTPASAQASDEPGAAAGEMPNVSGLEAFAAETNYMSKAGYLRLLVFREQGVWMSYAEAQRVVQSQGG